MSTKWTFIGSNSLESWDAERAMLDEKEEARRKWQKRQKLFKQTMKTHRMETNKPKKYYKSEDEIEVDTN